MTETPHRQGIEPSDFAELLGAPEALSDDEVQRARAMVLSGMFPREQGAVVDGRYSLKSEIGAGGIGRVYRAHDQKLSRDVAIKFLRTSAERRGSTDTLVQEAKVLARLQHPNIVAVYDVGHVDDELYLTMELVTGRSLDRWLAQQQRRWDTIVPVFQQAGAGLAAAHAAGVIHRDFKPSNAMVGDDGRVRVVDFGLARAFEPTAAPSQSSQSASVRTTAAGTHRYMAPEQFDGLASAASDQFGFCTSLFEALTGERAWKTAVNRGVEGRSRRSEPDQRLKTAGVPGWLRRTIVRGLRVAPSERFESMEDLCAALRAPRRWPLAASLATAVVGGALAWTTAAQQTGCEDAGAQARDLWTPQRRDAFLSMSDDTGTSEAFVSVIDEYVESWEALARQSCRAHGDGELAAAAHRRRLQCLNRSLYQVDYFLQETASSEPPRLQPRAARTLSALAQCRDDSALESMAPTGIYDQQFGDTLSEALSRAYVYKLLGDAQEYFNQLETAQASLSERGRAPHEEFILDNLYGAELSNRGRYAEAEAVLLPAVLKAEGGEASDGRTVLLRSALADAISQQRARAREGLLLAQLSAAASSTLEDGRAHEAVARVAVANAALAAGDPALALESSQKAVALSSQRSLQDQGLASAPLNAAEALAVYAQALLANGQPDAARKTYRDALSLLSGADNQGMLKARVQNNLAALVEADDATEAVRLLQSAATIKLRHGLDQEAALTLMNLGNNQIRQGAPEPALEAFARAENAAAQAPLGTRAKIAYNRALAELQLRRWGEATRSFDTVLRAAAKLGLADEDILVFSSLLGLGEALLEQHREKEALLVFERALAAENTRLSANDRAELRLGLSRSLAATDPPRARSVAREGLELLPHDRTGGALETKLRSVLESRR